MVIALKSMSVISVDKHFNIQTLKAVSQLLKKLKEDKVKVRLKGVGKKGIEYFKYNGVELLSEEVGLSSKPDYKSAADFIGWASNLTSRSGAYRPPNSCSSLRNSSSHLSPTSSRHFSLTSRK